MAFIDTIKGYFQTGDVPTQSQFWEFFSYIHWKDAGLGTEGSFGAATTISIPAKQKCKEIVFWSATDQWVKIGDNANGTQHGEIELTANTPHSYDLDLFTINAKTIHLTGENLATINYKVYIK
jgi:hypothetical protein